MNYGFIKVGTTVPDITVADCKNNTQRIIEAMNNAAERGVKVLCFPELCVTGSTCADLFYHTTLINAAQRSVLEIADANCGKDILVAVGFPLQQGSKLYNCAAVIHEGEILGIVTQTHTDKYFSPAPDCSTKIVFGGREVPFGSNLIFSCNNIPNLAICVEICEDLWAAENPSIRHTANGATIILNLAASGETIGKADYRRSLVSVQSAKLSCAYIYAGA